MGSIHTYYNMLRCALYGAYRKVPHDIINFIFQLQFGNLGHPLALQNGAGPHREPGQRRNACNCELVVAASFVAAVAIAAGVIVHYTTQT